MIFRSPFPDITIPHISFSVSGKILRRFLIERERANVAEEDAEVEHLNQQGPGGNSALASS